MARSRARKAKKKSRPAKTATKPTKPISWGGMAGGKAGTRVSAKGWAVRSALAAAAIAAAIGWWLSNQAERDFLDLALKGQGALKQIEAVPSAGGGHLGAGETWVYDSPFPTSGRHHRSWTDAGFYRDRQMATQLVHAIEHGNIVIYYDKPGPEVVETLKDWTGLYSSQWSGVVATPMAGLGAAVVLTAWAKRLRMTEFKPAAAAAFIDAYRGRGPEHPVR